MISRADLTLTRKANQSCTSQLEAELVEKSILILYSLNLANVYIFCCMHVIVILTVVIEFMCWCCDYLWERNTNRSSRKTKAERQKQQELWCIFGSCLVPAWSLKRRLTLYRAFILEFWFQAGYPISVPSCWPATFNCLLILDELCMMYPFALRGIEGRLLSKRDGKDAKKWKKGSFMCDRAALHASENNRALES